MPTDKPIHAVYDQGLLPMAAYIRDWWARSQTEAERNRAEHAVRDFCFRYPPKFKQDFFRAVGLDKTRRVELRDVAAATGPFMDQLLAMDGECVFILRDTYDFLTRYQEASGKGLGLLINRKNTFDHENQYLDLVGAFYDVLARTEDVREFKRQYLEFVCGRIRNDERLYRKAADIYAYVSARATDKKVIFVDLGFQFTFALFCYASVKFFRNDELDADFYALSTYPWLRPRFEDKAFTEKSEVVLSLERAGRGAFEAALAKRAAGALTGFAIGDALGFPVAGVEAGDVADRLGIALPLSGFQASPRHPIFRGLGAGQYTSNTIVMRLTAQSVAEQGAVHPEAIADALRDWGEEALHSPEQARWLGPTTASAIQRMTEGIPFTASGDAGSPSCACLYRAVPLGIFLRPMVHASLAEAKAAIAAVAGITHAHPASVAGAQVVASIIGDLLHGVPPGTAVRSAIALVPAEGETRTLRARLDEAVALSPDDEAARARLGSGSPVDQTLPLAIYFFLRYSADFGGGVLAAANSIRRDTPEEAAILGKYGFEEAMIEAKGGNTDGIAALTGAMLGAHLGLDAVPAQLKIVEAAEEIAKLGTSLL